MHFLVVRWWLIQSSLTVSSNRIVPCCDTAVLLHASGGASCWAWGGYSWTAGRTGTGPRHRQPQTSPTVPGAGLVDKVLPTGLVGHLDELVLVALGQHSLHGSWETQVWSVCVRSRCLEQAAAILAFSFPTCPCFFHFIHFRTGSFSCENQSYLLGNELSKLHSACGCISAAPRGAQSLPADPELGCSAASNLPSG